MLNLFRRMLDWFKSTGFDSKNLDEHQKRLIQQFHNRRQVFNDYLKQSGIARLTCPACGYPTLEKRDMYEICEICWWEDDGQDDPRADQVWGGPNGASSLTEWRLAVGKYFDEKKDCLPTLDSTAAEQITKILIARASILSKHTASMGDYRDQDDCKWAEYDRILEETRSMIKHM